MEHLDLSVIKQLNQWLNAGEACWLCTVIHTWGSAPRRPGSLLACNAAGDFIGSLSGGCVEDDLIESLQHGKLAAKASCYKVYGESTEEQERYNLPCGGTLGILIDTFVPNAHSKQYPSDIREAFRTLEQSLTNRQVVQRHCRWDEQGQVTELSVEPQSSPLAIELDLNEARQPQQLKHTSGPVVHLMILGVCETSRFLAQFALAVGYRVSICDPRPGLIDTWNIDHCNTHSGMPDDVIRQHAADANSAIVAVSHDPRVDDMGLMDTFNTKAFYIGAMGSSRTSANRRNRLQELGVSAEQLNRLHAPIGLDIGSKTPAEIAISIIGDIIAARNLAS